MRHWIMVGSLVLAIAAPAGATHHLVAPDGSGDFATIQDAVLSAAEGDTILLADGIFRGEGNRRIDMQGRGVTIRSQSGNAAACIIDIEGTALEQHYGFQFVRGEGPTTRLEWLTISNGCDLGC